MGTVEGPAEGWRERTRSMDAGCGKCCETWSQSMPGTKEMSNMGAKNSNHLSIPITGSISPIFIFGAIPRATLQPECQCVHLTDTEPGGHKQICLAPTELYLQWQKLLAWGLCLFFLTTLNTLYLFQDTPQLRREPPKSLKGL